MSNNFFDSDSDCGADIDNNNYPTELDSSFIPDDLYYNTQKIRRVQNEVERLKVQTYGGQSIKYRYWKMEDCKPSTGTYIWISELKFYEHTKTFFNGNQTDNSDCVAEDIMQMQRDLNDFTTTITPSVNSLAAPTWWSDRFGAAEPVGNGHLIDNNIYSSGRYYVGNLAGKKMSFTIDFGANKKYAISAITQRGARFSNMGIGSFVLYARNNTTDAWTKICEYRNLVDPINCAMGEDPVLKYYGANAPYYTVTRPNLYILGGNIYVYKPTPPRDSFPIDIKPMWGEEVDVKKYRYYRIDNIGPGYPTRQNLNIELFEGGGMYKAGRQYYPGKKINDQILKVKNDNSGSAPYTNYLFKDPKYFASLSINSPDDGVEIDFGECNKKAITGLRQITGGLPNKHMEQFNLSGRNSTSDDWEVLSRFGQATGYDGQIVTLTDPTEYSDDAISEYYAVLQTGVGNVAFPGDAAPMWYHPTGNGGAGRINRVQRIHYQNFENRVLPYAGMSSKDCSMCDTSRYDTFLFYDETDPLSFMSFQYPPSGNFPNSGDITFYLKHHGGRYVPGDLIEFEFNCRFKDIEYGGVNLTFYLDSDWPYGDKTGQAPAGTYAAEDHFNWIPSWSGDIFTVMDGFTPAPEFGFSYISTGMRMKNLKIILSSYDDGLTWDVDMSSTVLLPEV